ncbi:MAG: APC family permease, partial [Gammaproteobacteria bacterium]|nr:APC family permease [Gammaproteobacteria bacterium]MDX5375743.1 APC family permease [Gammaproteobacteria bacterium]
MSRSPSYEKNSLSLTGAVALGTGVMIGAGIFALTGQVAELAREWFVLAFVLAAIISGFSAYSYVKLSNAYPSAGGIAMFLQKAYGRSTITAAAGLLMYVSMVINESLVARTFGTYTLQLFDVGPDSWLVPALGVGLLFFAFLVNLRGNRFIQSLSFFMAFVKIGGILVFAVAGLWVAGLSMESVSVSPDDTTAGGFLAGVALAVLAYKGFTTITNSGSEIVDPHRNVGRAIIIAIGLCLLLYLLVTLAIGG